MDRTDDLTSGHDPNLLAAYVEGRLDDRERGLLTEHLAECGDCRHTLAMLARAPGALGDTAKPRRSRIPAWLAVAATLVLAVLGVRRAGGPVPVPAEHVPASTLAGAAPTTIAPAVAPEVAAESRSAPATEPMLDPGLLVKRGVSGRQVAGKTFRQRAGEWVDVDFDPTAPLSTTRVEGHAARAAIVQRIPALAPYAALGDSVLVVLDGTVYRFTP